MLRSFLRVARPRPLVATTARLFVSADAIGGYVVGTLGLLYGGVTHYQKLQKLKKDMKDIAVDLKIIPEEIIPQKLKEAKVTSSEAGKNYIDRPSIQRKIEYAFDNDVKGYFVVYGAKGMGKSEIVEHTAINLLSLSSLYLVLAQRKNW